MFWFFYLFQFFVIFCLIGIVLMQKESGSLKDNKMFGQRARISAVVRLTYVLIGLFIFNNLALIKLYRKKQIQEQIHAVQIKQNAKQATKSNSIIEKKEL